MKRLVTHPLRAIVGTAALMLMAAALPATAQERLRLWPDRPVPAQPEIVESQDDGSSIVRDVTDPTLTVYLPDPDTANGAAVIIAPGGAMRVLGVPAYRDSTARWLNERGVAAFVLHYRTLPTSYRLGTPGAPQLDYPKANANPFPDDQTMSQAIEEAITDGQKAVQIVRANAGKWHIDPERVGILGVSAGGGVGIGTLVRPSENGAPDFLISSFGPSLIDVTVPASKPPLFMAVRQFHPGVVGGLLSLFRTWTEAEAPAELHIYQQLEERPFLPPTGQWLEDAYVWMQARGIVPAAQPSGN